MEGAGEVSGPLGASAEAPNLTRKEGGGSPPANSRRMMEPSAPFVSDDGEWHDGVSLPRPLEAVTEATKGKDLARTMPPLARSGSLQGVAGRANDPDGMVEELTLKNFRILHGSESCHSNDGEAQVEKDPWLNFYKLSGDPRDVAMQEPELPENNIGVENASFSNFWSQKLLAKDNPGADGPSATRNPGCLGAEPSKGSGFIRTKVLPSSGFPQLLLKSNLKGKGVAYRYPGPQGSQQQGHGGNQTPVSIIERGASDASWRLNSRAKSVSPLYGGGGPLDVSSGKKEISLRVWLRYSEQNAGKSERLHVFRQILELVEASHHKGLVLQHLRPSYFTLLPTNKVNYVGAFASPKQVDFTEVSMDHVAENPSKRKRLTDASKESHNFLLTTGQKVDESQIAHGCSGMNKNLKGGQLSDDSSRELSLRENHERCSVYGVGATLPSTTCKRGASENMHLEEKWYASPEELRGSNCSFESNVYALGVLFFEIFCFFESWEAHAAIMSDLRYRILPSSFLSESSKEAGFCLWLLHPDPSSRPKTREILLSDLIFYSENILDDQLLASLEEDDNEADLLSHFLLSVKEEKEKQAQKLVKDIDCLRKDLEEIEKRQLSRITHLCATTSKDAQGSANHISDRFLHGSFHTGPVSRPSTPNVYEARLMKNIGQLENAYFSMRCEVETNESPGAERKDKDVLRSRDISSFGWSNEGESCFENETDRLGAFFDGLCKYARYNRFEVCGSLRNGDILNSSNVICSLSFDRDEEYFAAAGVSKKIKIFEYESLLNDAVDIHYPAIEMSSRSRLSCVCWNGYIKNYLASTDYEGTVQLWDASTGQGFAQYTEHQKRAWSVDFSHVDPMKLASGSDDYSVKLWKINEKNSTSTIRSVANVCCVQFSADSTNFLAFGSADYRIYCYDLRNVRVPWCTLVGHKKAVSYVRFVDSATLVSASTDNTLKLWDLNKTNPSGFSTNACSLTLNGHTNEKNFVGLSISDGYIACGSETNEVFAYYKSLPMPITSHKFGSIDPISGQETGDDNGQFVSSVCWRGKSNVVVAANSSGSIKVLQLV